MANNYGNYNNNDNRPTLNMFSPISFVNLDSRIQQTRLAIGYFNRVMSIAIAEKMPGQNAFNNDAQIKIYLSARNAKLLHDGIMAMKENGYNNVCVETNKGLLEVSNGAQYGSDSPCVVIHYVQDNNAEGKIIYQMRADDKIPYNFSDGSYNTLSLPNYEFDTFVMALKQYWLASSYAIAASVHESHLYREKATTDLLRAIADKVGARTQGSAGGGKQHSFLNNNQGEGNNPNGSIPQGYTQADFESIVGEMTAYGDD